MSEEQPPPGAPVPGAGPAYAANPGQGWAGGPPPPPPAPMYAAGARPLHQPGTVPLRPLTLSDFFDAAFRTVRRNPKATIGMGALVTTAFLALPFVVTVALGAAGRLGGTSYDGTGGSQVFGDLATTLSGVVTGVLGGLAGVVVAGLIVPVVTRAAIGRRLTIGESWQRARGRLLALLGLTLLEALVAVVVVVVVAVIVALVVVSAGNVLLGVLLGLLLGLLGLVGLLAVHVKWFQLAAPVLVSERRGVLASLARAGRLTSGSFWRVLGVWLLVTVASSFAGQLLTIPLSVLGAVAGVALPGSLGTTVLLVSSQLGSVLSGAVVAPFTGTVAVLQYLDQRFRKEGFDIELIAYTDEVARREGGR